MRLAARLPAFGVLSALTGLMVSSAPPALAHDIAEDTAAALRACHDHAWHEAYPELPNAAVSSFPLAARDARQIVFWAVHWDDPRVRAAGDCTVVDGAVVAFEDYTRIASGAGETAAVSWAEVEGLLLSSAGYRATDDPCRRAGETAITSNWLDDSADMVACPTGDPSIGDLVEGLGARAVDATASYTLFSVPRE